ncbi:hypothetical protein ScPMuIL_018543 [Solemya velum]
MGAVCGGGSTDGALQKTGVQPPVDTDGHPQRINHTVPESKFGNAETKNETGEYTDIPSYPIKHADSKSKQELPVSTGTSFDNTSRVAVIESHITEQAVPVVAKTYNIPNVEKLGDTTETYSSEIKSEETERGDSHSASEQLTTVFPHHLNSTIQKSVRMNNQTDLSAVRKGFDECINSLKLIRTKKNFKEVADLMKNKMEDSNVYDPFEQRRQLGDYLFQLGCGYAELAFDIYDFIMRKIGEAAVTEVLLYQVHENPSILLLSAIRNSLWTYSDASYKLGKAIADTNLFRYIVGDLQAIYDEGLDDLTPKDKAFHSAVGILNNCARSPFVYKESFRKFCLARKLHVFLESKSNVIKVVTLLCLANITSHENEEETQLLAGEEEDFDYFIDMIEKTWDNPNHAEGGFSLEELVSGLGKMAKNDSNRQLLMDNCGGRLITQLKHIMKKGKIEEKESAVTTVWELAFDDKYKEELKEDTELLECIEQLKENPRESVSRAAGNAHFVIFSKEKKTVSDDRAKRKKEDIKASKGHIMISYNWVDQKLLKQVYERLKAQKYSIWMDIDKMEGSLLQSMADAVENARIVLVCYSEKYKESQNCRMEAVYAQKLGKQIIPLKMQTGYEPKGWLGIIVADKLYYEFTTKYPFEQKMKELLKVIAAGKAVDYDEPEVSPAVTTVEPVRSLVSTWTSSQIDNWLNGNSLFGYTQLKNLTGEHIEFLQELSRMAPEFYFHCLESKLKLTSLEELMRFNKAMKNL